MTYTLRISKYNPIYRDPIKGYMLDEWTECSDIGKKFNGEIFTENEYLLVEEKYIDTCIMAMDELELKKMKIDTLSKIGFIEDHFADTDDIEELRDFYNKVHNKMWVDKKEFKILMKLILRDILWARLFSEKKGKKNLIIYTGYDFYMYFVVNDKLKNTRKRIHEDSLFEENFPAYWGWKKW